MKNLTKQIVAYLFGGLIGLIGFMMLNLFSNLSILHITFVTVFLIWMPTWFLTCKGLEVE